MTRSSSHSSSPRRSTGPSIGRTSSAPPSTTPTRCTSQTCSTSPTPASPTSTSSPSSTSGWRSRRCGSRSCGSHWSAAPIRAPSALLWPLLAALACSEAQISIFEHGLTALGQNLTTTLAVVGAWCLARWPGRLRALWPTLGAGIAAGTAIGALPYLYFLVLHYAPGAANAAVKSPLRVLVTPPTILGLPLALGYSRPLAGIIGLGSIGLALLGLALLWRLRRTAVPRRAAPALILLTYGAVVAVQIGVFRGATAAWYTYVGMAFWTGLSGFA